MSTPGCRDSGGLLLASVALAAGGDDRVRAAGRRNAVSGVQVAGFLDQFETDDFQFPDHHGVIAVARYARATCGQVSKIVRYR